jgi:3-polyprenyl-4-hydroxybenzoate decarboxylase
VTAKEATDHEGAHMWQSIRVFSSVLQEAGDLISILQPVRLEYEVAVRFVEADGEPAPHFTNVEGLWGPAQCQS